MSILKSQNKWQDLSSAMNNFGVLAEMNNQMDSALYYYNQALTINIKIKDSIGMPYTLSNIAGIYFIKKDFNEGLKFINKSTLIREKLNDKLGMAWNEHSIGEVFMAEGNSLQALKHFRISLSYSTKAAYPDLISKNFKNIAFIMHQLNKSDSAYFYFNSFHNINDSLYNSQNQKQLVEMESIYENEKKSSQIKELNVENQLKENELEKKRVIQIFLVLIVLSALVFTFFLLKAYKEKKKANELISLQKIETEKQKHIVEEKQKEIIDSINYAKRIQSAYLPPEEVFHRVFKDAFLLFKPKDIVSGDFYWFYMQNGDVNSDIVFCAVADCTGHGVPGALMSVICCNALNEVVVKGKETDTGSILNKTRDIVKQNLKSTTYSGQKDGMDIALIKLNTKTGELWYSGAYNPIWIVSNGELIELTADKQPVGIHEKEIDFKTTFIQLKKQDVVYLFSDGYADQFGGIKEKKFKYKSLAEQMVKNHTSSMENQKTILLETFENWKGNLEQVDDVCIIGIRFQ